MARPLVTAKVPRKRRTKAEMERARKKAIAARKHHLKTKHHMTVEEYDELKTFQGGVCPLCLRANGATKALAVEHDHARAKLCDHPENESCRDCWRGECCGPCNDILAHSRDSIEFFERCIDYLQNPPAAQLWPRERRFLWVFWKHCLSLFLFSSCATLSPGRGGSCSRR